MGQIVKTSGQRLRAARLDFINRADSALCRNKNRNLSEPLPSTAKIPQPDIPSEVDQRSAAHVIASMALRCFALGGRGSFMCSGSKCSCDFLLHCRNSSIQETTSSWSGGKEKLPRLKSRPIFGTRFHVQHDLRDVHVEKPTRYLL